jgi:dTDP-glucose pyrophosphorylase
MILDKSRHFIYSHFSIREVLGKLNDLAPDAIAFLVDDAHRLIGSVTDGDMRRGFIGGFDFDTPIERFIQPNPHTLRKCELTPDNYRRLKDLRIKIVPIVDNGNVVIDVINIDKYKSLLPLEAIIMAGGEGVRLRPMTLTTPKPLLKVGDKPIMEHSVDRLREFGVFRFTFCIRYLGEQIEAYFSDGRDRGLDIRYIREGEAMGTIGSVALVEDFHHEQVLVMNSDLLTNIDFEDMLREMWVNEADMMVATAPYHINIPYGVVETSGPRIKSLKEKPVYTFYSNAGIYIIKREYLGLIPKGVAFNATDLMELMIGQGRRVTHYPILGYWLDIGKPEDFEKAQNDIRHIKF